MQYPLQIVVIQEICGQTLIIQTVWNAVRSAQNMIVRALLQPGVTTAVDAVAGNAYRQHAPTVETHPTILQHTNAVNILLEHFL